MDNKSNFLKQESEKQMYVYFYRLYLKKLYEFIHEKKGMFPLKCEVKVPNKRIGLACLFRLLKFIKGNGVYLSLMGCTG
jgi:hypothetical protein